jgi:hypothetical protein
MRRRFASQTATALASLAVSLFYYVSVFRHTAPNRCALAHRIHRRYDAQRGDGQASIASGGSTQYCAAASPSIVPFRRPPSSRRLRNGGRRSGKRRRGLPFTIRLDQQPPVKLIKIGPVVTAGGTSNTERSRHVCVQSTFTLPVGATGIVLNDTLRSDWRDCGVPRASAQDAGDCRLHGPHRRQLQLDR